MDDSIPVSKLTWAVLLGRWTSFARSALALPKDAQGLRMRESIADIITLQAICMSLQEIESLEPDERRLGLERARWLVERHTKAIEARYASNFMPDGLSQLLDEAKRSLEDAESDALEAGIIEQPRHRPELRFEDLD